MSAPNVACQQQALPELSTNAVIAGLDPAIHHLLKMDARVKPAHDS
jgi:hypothetical protein